MFAIFENFPLIFTYYRNKRFKYFLPLCLELLTNIIYNGIIGNLGNHIIGSPHILISEGENT